MIMLWRRRHATTTLTRTRTPNGLPPADAEAAAERVWAVPWERLPAQPGCRLLCLLQTLQVHHRWVGAPHGSLHFYRCLGAGCRPRRGVGSPCWRDRAAVGRGTGRGRPVSRPTTYASPRPLLQPRWRPNTGTMPRTRSSSRRKGGLDGSEQEAPPPQQNTRGAGTAEPTATSSLWQHASWSRLGCGPVLPSCPPQQMRCSLFH